ncbi:hypothetical protein AX15_001941 [Amanita polypyramis BW_CC]|nr:hypothetical protein AX15_001941 [Amanita polypyramis BW_CC]
MSINEPFALATYKSALYASVNADNVSVSVQTDGVHVIQLSTLRPVISHTLGPSTSFACSPLAVSNGKIHTIYAPIQSSSELTDEQSQGRVIWIWREDLDSTIADRAEAHKNKTSVVVPHAIARLHYVPELPGQIIVLSPGGIITTLGSENFQVQATWDPQSDGASYMLLKSFIYARIDCSFLPPLEAPQTGAVVVLILADSHSNDIRITVCIASGGESTFATIGNCHTGFKQNEVLDMSCSSSGCFSVLSKSGEWHSFVISSSEDEPIILLQAGDPVSLKNIKISPDASYKSVALLPLTSSHVLLVGVSSSSPEIVLHIWDLQYFVLLASHILPVPSSFASTSSTVSITLASFPSSPPSILLSTTPKSTLINSQALLIISPPSPMPTITKSIVKSKPKSSTAATLSTIFVVPYVIPRVSTIANAMGRARASSAWISLPENQQQNESGDGAVHGGLDKSRKEVLKAMSAAMDGKRPQAANEAFFKWEECRSQAANGRLVYGHEFIKQVLEVVLQPAKNPATVMYSSEVVRHLIKRKVVSNSMLEGGLVRALRAKNDWTSIQLALKILVDVTESEIVETLWNIVSAVQENHRSSGPDCMQIDESGKDIPSLSSFLGHCVNYRTTPAQLRLALRQEQSRTSSNTFGVSTAECTLVILRVLIGWVQYWTDRDVALLPVDKGIREGGDWAANEDEEMRDKGEMPKLDQIASFTEGLLDATFLALLQHPPAEGVLRQLGSLLEAEISFTEAIQPLYGALGDFARAHSKAKHEAEEKGAGVVRTGRENPESWRQRRKRQHEQAGIGIGLYRVEELML